MQKAQIVARVMSCCQAMMHAGRWSALRDAAVALVGGAKLSLASLALGTERETALRHRVKFIDRLLGNTHLWAQRIEVYGALADWLLHDVEQVLIVVDWSSLSADLKWHWLRASIVLEGRSLTLYEEVHARKHLGNYQVHRRFVERLAQILMPLGRTPIVITDAGFRGTWFQLLRGQGWHWIGRVRNRDFVRTAQSDWYPAKQLYRRATSEAQDLGAFESARSNPTRCRLVLVKRKPTGRKHRYPSGKEQRHTQAKKNAALNREPWLLSCAPGLAHLSAQAVINIYAQRMRIEQEFRDTKNIVLGMGLSQARSSGAQRLQVLLLIARIAQMAQRLIGEAAKTQQLELQLMCTNGSTHREISVMTLARRVIDHPRLFRSLGDVSGAWHTVRSQINNAVPHMSFAA